MAALNINCWISHLEWLGDFVGSLAACYDFLDWARARLFPSLVFVFVFDSLILVCEILV